MTSQDKPKPYREESFQIFVDAISRQSAERWARGGWIRKREKDGSRSKPPAVQEQATKTLPSVP
jgi:hypothetical protein